MDIYLEAEIKNLQKRQAKNSQRIGEFMDLQKKQEKSIHDGHRVRLIDMVNRVGLENVTPIQALEFILFYIFPRGDVNPLAHRLLDRFNSVATILEASVEDLKAVKGMGETSAKKLRSLLDIFYYYSFAKMEGDDNVQTTGEFYDYIEQLLRYRTEEELLIFGVNPSGVVTKGRRFSKGGASQVGITLHDISLYISTHKVKRVILVHNHPKGSCVASKQDVESYQNLKNMFNFAGCKLQDMAIVGTDGIYSIEKEGFQRLFNVSLENLPLIGLKTHQ